MSDITANLRQRLAGNTCIGNEKKPLKQNDVLKYFRNDDGKLQCYNLSALVRIWTKDPETKGFFPGSTTKRVPDLVEYAVNDLSASDRQPLSNTGFLKIPLQIGDEQKWFGNDVRGIVHDLAKKNNHSAIQLGTEGQISDVINQAEIAHSSNPMTLGTKTIGSLDIRFQYDFSKRMFWLQSYEHLILEIQTPHSRPVVLHGVQEEIEKYLLPSMNELDDAVQQLPGTNQVPWKEDGLAFRVLQMEDGRLHLISLFSTELWSNIGILVQLALILRCDVDVLVDELVTGRTLRCGPNLAEAQRKYSYHYRVESPEGYIFRRYGKYIFQEERPVELEGNPFIEDTEQYLNLWRNLCFSQYEIMSKFGKEFSLSQQQAYTLICESLLIDDSPVLQLYFDLLGEHARDAVTLQQIAYKKRSIDDLEMSLFLCISNHSSEKCLNLQSRFAQDYPDIVKSMKYLRTLPVFQQWIVNMYTVNDAAFNGPLLAVSQDHVDPSVSIRAGHCELVREMDQILANAPKTSQPLFVFRGLHVDSEDQIRTTVTTFTSVSYNYKSSLHFAGDKCCMMVIRVKPGTPIAAIDELSHFHTLDTSEHEILLPRNSIFVDVEDEYEFSQQMYRFLGRDNNIPASGPKLKFYDLKFAPKLDQRLFDYVRNHTRPNDPVTYEPLRSERLNDMLESIQNQTFSTDEEIRVFVSSEEFTDFLTQVVSQTLKRLLIKYGLINGLTTFTELYSIKFLNSVIPTPLTEDDVANEMIQAKVRQLAKSRFEPKRHRILI